MDIETSIAVPTEPWEVARLRFMEELSEEEKKQFNEASLENLSYSTDTAMKKYKQESRMQAALKKLQPFLDTIEDFSKAMDVFTNTAPLFLAPIWGSVRVVLQVSNTYVKFLQEVCL